jgi:hypothetical protein
MSSEYPTKFSIDEMARIPGGAIGRISHININVSQSGKVVILYNVNVKTDTGYVVKLFAEDELTLAFS